MLKRLATQPSRRITIVGTLVAAIAFVIVFILMQMVSAPIDSSYDVIALEFAGTTENMDVIISEWGMGPDIIDRMILVHYLDLVYLLAYSSLLAGLALLVSRGFKEEKYQFIGFYFVLASFIAAGFDVIENINLLLVLYSPGAYPSFAPFLASITAAIKFGLIILVIIFVLAGTSVHILRKIRK